MHSREIEQQTHSHRFGPATRSAERRTWLVVLITAATMIAEIVFGWLSGSMALLADGWHMGTHVLALGVTIIAYRFARRHRDNPAFTFGTGKVGSLAGFGSAIILGVVGLGMITESVARLIEPVAIDVPQAFVVACVGLGVNLISAVVLHGGGSSHGHDHHHGEDHGHGGHGHHDHTHHDHNLRAAFLHVLTDALTSVLAIAALGGVYYYHVNWVDPAIGVLGGVVIGVWAIGLLRDTGRTLLDAGVDGRTVLRVREVIEADADNRVSDLHVWSLGGRDLSVAMTVVTHSVRPPDHYRQLLESVPGVRHCTIEVVKCRDDCASRAGPDETQSTEGDC